MVAAEVRAAAVRAAAARAAAAPAAVARREEVRPAAARRAAARRAAGTVGRRHVGRRHVRRGRHGDRRRDVGRRGHGFEAPDRDPGEAVVERCRRSQDQSECVEGGEGADVVARRAAEGATRRRAPGHLPGRDRRAERSRPRRASAKLLRGRARPHRARVCSGNAPRTRSDSVTGRRARGTAAPLRRHGDPRGRRPAPAPRGDLRPGRAVRRRAGRVQVAAGRPRQLERLQLRGLPLRATRRRRARRRRLREGARDRTGARRRARGQGLRRGPPRQGDGDPRGDGEGRERAEGGLPLAARDLVGRRRRQAGRTRPRGARAGGDSRRPGPPEAARGDRARDRREGPGAPRVRRSTSACGALRRTPGSRDFASSCSSRTVRPRRLSSPSGTPRRPPRTTRSPSSSRRCWRCGARRTRRPWRS